MPDSTNDGGRCMNENHQRGPTRVGKREHERGRASMRVGTNDGGLCTNKNHQRGPTRVSKHENERRGASMQVGTNEGGTNERQWGLTNESGRCTNEGQCCTNEGWCRGWVSSSLIGGSSPPLLLLLQPLRYLAKCAATSIDVCGLLPRGCNEVGGGQTRGY